MGVVKTIYVLGIGIAGISAMLAVAAHGQMDTTASSYGPKAEAVVDANGNLHVPDAYRTTYQSLGTWAVAAGQGEGSKELHVVYASPETITAYRKNGRFPDGAVLVKEVFEAATGQMTTGTVSRADTLKGWFVMMKDSKGRYAGNKLWGDGWGWSWFDAADPAKTTSTDYKTNCLPCHVPAQASDWVYVGGYPPLRR
jgi:Cytochrome P460